jgi:hypothetical protein
LGEIIYIVIAYVCRCCVIKLKENYVFVILKIQTRGNEFAKVFLYRGVNFTYL